MGADIFGYGNAGVSLVLGNDTHLDSRFSGGGGYELYDCPFVLKCD